jgi:hypothetical protein
MISVRRAASWTLGALLVHGCRIAPCWAEPQPAAGQQRPAVRAVARIAAGSVQIDGELSEAVWRNAEAVPLAYEWWPGEGIAPPVATDAYVLFDEKNLYIAFRAYDPEPSAIRAHLMDRDSIDSFVQDDHVTVMLDTYDDSRRAFEFRVNPLGVQADAIFSEIDGGEDFSWDLIWHSAGAIDAQGYVVEMAIPFHQLRFPRGGAPLTWGIGFERSYPRDVRHRMEAHRADRNNSCVLCQKPRFTGFDGLQPGHNLDLTPTLTYDRTDQAAGPGGDLAKGDENLEPGLSLRWGITPSMTLNATINPDFSQVEADASQLYVNERFALSFPEKRPFFQEGSDYFATQIQGVFTRTIVDPQWGLKLTGKAGRNALGFFVARDQVNNILVPANDGTTLGRLEGSVSTTVGRWRRDFGAASTVGVLLTDREGEDGYYNRVGGIDTYWRLNENQVVSFQALASETDYPDAFARVLGEEQDAFGGHAIEAFWNYRDRDWGASAGWRLFDDGFRADAGFVPQVDIETWRGSLQRTIWGAAEDFFHQIAVGGTLFHSRNVAGELTANKFELRAGFAGPLQSQTDLIGVWREERVRGILFEDLYSTSLDFAFQPSDNLRFIFQGLDGVTVESWNLVEADDRQFRIDAEIKLGSHLNTQVSLIQQTIDVDEGRLYRARLSDLKLTWQFTVRTFVRCLFQWQDIDYQPEHFLADPPDDLETLASQLLFSYKINPQTVLFVGYSDQYLDIPTLQSGLEIDRRTFFAKMSYAISR